ncbi:MAG: RNA 2'-phosphotransferase [Planktomarina sp.]
MKIDKTKPDRNISKRLSKVLRHAPEAMGLTLDDGGWVAVDQVLAGFARQGRSIGRDDLQRVVDTNDKKRFTFSDDGLRIRAAQGHSVNVDLGLNHAEPSAILYHGTAEANLAAIKRDGLKPQSRQQVHLSSDRDTARRVGARHGKPRILQVDTAKMVRAGHKFYLADNGVWLTDAVLPEYLSGF